LGSLDQAQKIKAVTCPIPGTSRPKEIINKTNHSSKMKKSPAEILQSQLDAFNSINQEAKSLRTRLTTEQAELANISANGDLNDEKVISQIGRLQIFTNLFPARITAREAAIGPAEQDLLSACEQFISSALAPRLRDLKSRAQVKAKAQLEPCFSYNYDLDEAVSKTKIIVELEKFLSIATIRRNPMRGVINYAEELLQTWTDLKPIEAELA
jgi:hypothetical protein